MLCYAIIEGRSVMHPPTFEPLALYSVACMDKSFVISWAGWLEFFTLMACALFEGCIIKTLTQHGVVFVGIYYREPNTSIEVLKI